MYHTIIPVDHGGGLAEGGVAGVGVGAGFGFHYKVSNAFIIKLPMTNRKVVNKKNTSKNKNEIDVKINTVINMNP